MRSVAMDPTFCWGAADGLLDRLEGTWVLSRIIEAQATMTGRAAFNRQDADTLTYREEGRVQLADGKSFDAHREYRFQRAPGGFTVYFAELPPRVFHNIELMRAGDAFIGQATHLCTPDVYESAYCFRSDGTFSIRHTVHGPRKDYVSITVFKRLEKQ